MSTTLNDLPGLHNRETHVGAPEPGAPTARISASDASRLDCPGPSRLVSIDEDEDARIRWGSDGGANCD